MLVHIISGYMLENIKTCHALLSHVRPG